MKQPAHIAAATSVTALGDNTETLWKALLAQQCGVADVTRFDTDSLHCHQAACIPGLAPGPDGNRTSALLRRTLQDLPGLPQHTRILWTGVKGNAECLEAGPDAQMPRWPGDYRRIAAEALGLSGEGLDLNAACASSTAGMALAAHWVTTGRCASVLVCAADIVSRFTFTGFAALRALSESDTPRPFDKKRDGLCLGDGACAVWICSQDVLETTGRNSLARIAGWGIANDANHITGPARDGRGLIAAIRLALETANLHPRDIGAFCAHGTATVYNDAMELTALENIFGQHRFPVFSVKGATGHTLGAAGGIEAAISAWALREKTAPPSVHCDEPEERAEGRVSTAPQPFGADAVLTTNSGFGGVNAALVVQK